MLFNEAGWGQGDCRRPCFAEMGGDDFSLRLRSEDIYVFATIKKLTRRENVLRPTDPYLA
jgi:hypothetical protein